MAYGVQFKDHPTIQVAAEEAVLRVGYAEQRVGVVFRVEAQRYAAIQPYADPVTGDGEWYVTDPVLELYAYAVKKWTPCGATLFLQTDFGRPKVAIFTHTKQFACRTVEEALESFRQRRLSQIRRLKAQLSRAEYELDLVEGIIGPWATHGYVDGLLANTKPTGLEHLLAGTSG